MSLDSLNADENLVSVKNLTKMQNDRLKLWSWVYKGKFDEMGELITINSSGYQLPDDLEEVKDTEEHNEITAQESPVTRLIKKIY